MERIGIAVLLLCVMSCDREQSCDAIFFENDIPQGIVIPADSISAIYFNILEFNEIDRLSCRPELAVVKLGQTVDDWQIVGDTIIWSIVGYEKREGVLLHGNYPPDVTSITPLAAITYLKIVKGAQTDSRGSNIHLPQRFMARVAGRIFCVKIRSREWRFF